MKKLHAISGLMMAAIVALSGCQPKEQVEVLVYPDTFSVTASLDGTKTTNGGLSTLWAENDAINVFFTQDNTFQSAGKLTLSDGADTKKGVFTAESSPAVGTGEHDWYAVYPYNDKRTSPASYTKEDGYVYVGDTRGLTQSVYNVLDVVCGSACPMYAVAKNVTGTNPAFTMKQLASVIEFKVVNKTGAPLKVSSVTLDESESGEAVVGSFFMDFTGEAPVYTKSDDSSYWSSLAVTRIANPGELAVDEAAFVYMPIKPYTHVDTQDFKVIVEGEQGGKEGKAVLTLRPAAEKCTFAAGKIKTVTLNVETFEVDPDPAFVFNTEEAITALGQVVPGADNDGATSLDGVTLTSTDGIQLSFSKGSASTVPRLWKTSTAYDLRFYKGNTLSFAAPAGYSIVRIAFDGAKADKTATSNPEGYSAGEWTGKSSTVLLYPGETFNVDKIFVVLESGENPLEPWLTVNPTSVSVKAAASTSTVAVSSDDAAWTVSTTASWFTVEKDGNSVKISVEANDSDKERSELFVVKHATSSLLEVNVTVTQEAGEAPATIANALAGEAETSYRIASATIVSQVKGNLFVSDGTGVILVYNKNNTLEKGQKISISGKTKAYNGLREFENPTITVLDGTESVSLTPEAWTDEQMAGAYGQGNEKVAYVSYTATLSSANNGIIPGSEAILYMSKADGVSTTQDKTYILTGFVYGWTDYKKDGVTTKEVCMYVEKAVNAESGTPDPYLTLNGSNNATVSFDAVPAANQEVKVASDNDEWTVTGAPDWVTVREDKENSKIIIAVSENTGDKRQAELSVNHSNGELVRTLTVIQAAKPSGETGSNTCTLSNADIVAAGDGADGYKSWKVTNSEGMIFNAYAIKKAHSNKTSDYHYLQIKKYTTNQPYFIQIPELGTKIISIKMTVSNTQKPMDGGSNSSSLFFSASNTTDAAGDGVVSASGASTVTIDASSLNLNTGYITASGAVRIWDIEISYN